MMAIMGIHPLHRVLGVSIMKVPLRLLIMCRIYLEHRGHSLSVTGEARAVWLLAILLRVHGGIGVREGNSLANVGEVGGPPSMVVMQQV